MKIGEVVSLYKEEAVKAGVKLPLLVLTHPQVSLLGLTQYGGGNPLFILLNRSFVLYNKREYVLNTIRHELAHVLADDFHGDPHGEAWKIVARRLGASPTAYSCYADLVYPALDSYDVSHISIIRFVTGCLAWKAFKIKEEAHGQKIRLCVGDYTV